MRICLVSDQLVGYHDSWSGAELVCKQAAEFLEKEGHRVSFITASSKKREGFPNVFPIPIFNVKQAFLKVITMPLFRFLGAFYSIYYLRKEKPDIIHLFHSNYLSIPVMIGAIVLKIPTVFTVLDYFMICPRNNLRLDGGKICDEREGKRCLKCVSFSKFSEKSIIRFFLKRLKRIITFTETSKVRLIKHGIPAEKIRVIYTYDFPLAREKKEDKEIIPNSVLFVGTFYEYKGLQVFIQAVPKIISEVPDSKIMIVGFGNDNDKARVEKLVKDLGIGNYVEFLGRKKNEEVLEIVSKGEMVVVPEQWPSDFGPLILVEAMVLGKPVVGGNIGSIPEFIKDGVNGFLPEFNNPNQFAEKIIWLLKNKSEAKLMGERARESAKEFFNCDWREKIIKVYNDMARKPRQ